MGTFILSKIIHMEELHHGHIGRHFTRVRLVSMQEVHTRSNRLSLSLMVNRQKSEISESFTENCQKSLE